MARGQLRPPLQSTAPTGGEAAVAGARPLRWGDGVVVVAERGPCEGEAAVALRRRRVWPLHWEDGAIAVAERGPCEGEAAAAVAAARHGPCAEGDGVVANQSGRAEVLSSTRPGAAASAAALGHGPRAWRDCPVAD